MARTKASYSATIDPNGIEANTRHVKVPIRLDQDPTREVWATVRPYELERIIRKLRAAKNAL